MRIMKGRMYLRVSSTTVIGEISAAMPVMRSVLVIQEPMALPSAMFPNRRRAAAIATLNSGTVVPMATKMLLVNKETGDSKEIDYVVEKDECNRPETTAEGLASLKPVFDPENGSVTAGNSSQLSDGSSVTLVMSEEKALELGLKPIAYFRGFTTMGCEQIGRAHV